MSADLLEGIAKLRAAVEEGGHIGEHYLIVASTIVAAPLDDVARTRLIAFCLQKERDVIIRAIESTLEQAYARGMGDPATLATVLKAVRLIRELPR